MSDIRRDLCAILLLLVVLPTARAAVPDFDRDIAPLLAQRCLDCHSGATPRAKLDLAHRKSASAVIVAGKPDQSLLWQRIHDDEMPPRKPLPAAERSLLRDWIAAGARWGADPIDPFRLTTTTRAGYDWWALQPLARSIPPQVKNAAWASNPIDRFLLARLEAKKLLPSNDLLAPGKEQSANRRILIRRVTFDLTGLPPTAEEVATFLEDAHPAAYERLVDRLLATPAFGERWGRHWLDVVRYGESDGFERDLPRFWAWPYRDWVVDALNQDLPWAEFVKQQLAGDALQPGDPTALAATGFLVAGAHDIVVPVSETMKASMRQDELEDIVGTVAQTFLGLTVNCARCHDHKFDPIFQKDYYRLAAALAGVGHGERSVKTSKNSTLTVSLRRRLEVVVQHLARIEEPVRQRLVREKGKTRTIGPKPLAEWDFTRGLTDLAGTLPGKLKGGARQEKAGLIVDGRAGFAATAPLVKDLREKTLEVQVRLDNLSQRGGGAISVQTLDGQVFDAIVFGEQEPQRWMAGSDGFSRTRSFAGPAEKEANNRIVHIAITYQGDGTITGYRDGLPYGKPYRSRGPITFRAGEAQVVFGLRHGSAGGNKMLAALVRSARLYDRALSAREIAASAGLPTVTAEEISSQLTSSEHRKHQDLLDERDRLSSQLEKLARVGDRKVYAIVPAQPGLTHVLRRGNVTAKGEVVAPEVLTALARRAGTTGLKPDAPEGQRRLALAQWITNNPLFARVIVNRLWHHHFGVGLVDTPNDFGFNGGRPTHPELLDFLAGALLAEGGSLKALHRLIVCSTAYRQSSRDRPDAAKIDADNRLLWRKSPSRLEAEAVRDSILAVAGRLDRRMGGPSYLDFRSYFFKGTQFYDPIDQVGAEFTRRSLYRMWARGGRSPFLDTFDCPDPSTTTPKRAVTTTPLQALTLFNNAMVLDLAEKFAQRLRREAGTEPGQQVRRAFLLAYAREAEEKELAFILPFVRRHGLEAFCRVVFNSNEFVRVD